MNADLVIQGENGTVTAVELLNIVNNTKQAPLKSRESLQKIDFTNQGNDFEKNIAGFFHFLGFDVAYSHGSLVDFVAVAKGNSGPLFIIGECQTNLATREHADKLYTASRMIQDYCNQKKVNGCLESVHALNIEAKFIPKDIRDLLFSRALILLDKNLLLTFTSQCSNPEEAFKFITSNRATALTARF